MSPLRKTNLKHPKYHLTLIATAWLWLPFGGVQAVAASPEEEAFIEFLYEMSDQELVELWAEMAEGSERRKVKIRDLVWGEGTAKDSQEKALERAKENAQKQCDAKGKDFRPLNAPNGVPPNEACGPTAIGGYRCRVVGTCEPRPDKPKTDDKKKDKETSGAGSVNGDVLGN